MESQSIGAVPGSTTLSQSGQASASQAVAASGLAEAKAAQVQAADRSVDDDVRTRDPRSLQFQVDGSTKQVVTTIVDEHNKTVIVQIPSEEVLRIAKAIDRMKGFLLEGKA